FLVAFGAPALVRDRGVVLRAQLAEGDLGAGFGGVVEANGDRDHSERDHAFPHRSRHGDAVYLLSSCLATFRRCWVGAFLMPTPMRRRPAVASQVSSFRGP